MDIVNNAINAVGTAFTTTFPNISIGQIIIVGLLLLLLVIVFICALIAKGRGKRELAIEKDNLAQQLRDKQADFDRQLSDKQKSCDKLIAASDKEKQVKDDEIADLNAQLDVLKQFHEKYQHIPDAEKEAAKILNEAKNKAFVVASRTEKEYVELIDHANKEAESIRQLAQERLTRSHEMLKSAIARANEIVDEAKSDLARATGVTYVPEPARIEAPAPEEDKAEEPVLDDKAEQIEE